MKCSQCNKTLVSVKDTLYNGLYDSEPESCKYARKIMEEVYMSSKGEKKMEYKEDYRIINSDLKCDNCQEYLKTREYYVGDFELEIICQNCYNKLPHKPQIIKTEIEILKIEKWNSQYCEIHNCKSNGKFKISCHLKNNCLNIYFVVCQKHRYDSTLFGEKIA